MSNVKFMEKRIAYLEERIRHCQDLIREYREAIGEFETLIEGFREVCKHTETERQDSHLAVMIVCKSCGKYIDCE